MARVCVCVDMVYYSCRGKQNCEHTVTCRDFLGDVEVYGYPKVIFRLRLGLGLELGKWWLWVGLG